MTKINKIFTESMPELSAEDAARLDIVKNEQGDPNCRGGTERRAQPTVLMRTKSNGRSQRFGMRKCG